MTPTYTAHEERCNAWTHGAGVCASVLAGGVLIVMMGIWGDGWRLAASIVFVSTLILLYTASTLYHAIEEPGWKARLKVLDHCAIYLLIAGTYTPFTLVGLREVGGWWMFAAIWTLALVGVIFKLFYTGRFKLLSTLIYLAMGWLAIVAIRPMTEHLSTMTLLLVISGGLAYTLGTLFYMSRRKYAHAIWHGFVLAGSSLHFAAVATHLMR